jgi:hypothetical protein
LPLHETITIANCDLETRRRAAQACGVAKRGRRNTRPMRLQTIERTVLILRGHGVMLDADLAAVYGVTTKALNQAVKRNIRRFPKDFRFRVTKAERDKVVTNCDHLRRLRFSRVLPWAFTEHGAIMAASVLKSSRAIEMSVFVVRAFIRLRDLTRSHAELVGKLDAIERRVTGHDEDIEQMFAALRTLIEPPRKQRRQIGFRTPLRVLESGSGRQ